MKKRRNKLSDPGELRKIAESKLKYKTIPVHRMSESDIAAIIHELKVNQIELEMQNEELRNMQGRLEESLSRYGDLYDFAPVGYFVVDYNGLIIDINLTCAATLGMERDELRKKPFMLFVDKNDQNNFFQHRRKVIKTGLKCTCELRIKKIDGSRFWAHLQSAPQSEGGNIYCRTAMTDITEQKRAEIQNMAGAALHERQQLAQVLHDNLQQLLVAARVRIDSLSRDFPDLSDSLEEVSNLLTESIDISKSLTVELCPPVIHESSLNNMAGWIAERMREMHNLNVEIRAGNEIKLRDEYFRVILFDAVRELLFNVVKHARTDHAQIHLSGAGDGRVAIQVFDSGTGFEPSHHLNGDAAASNFGISRIRRQLDLIGGSLELDSAPGKGTCATLALPVLPSVTIEPLRQVAERRRERQKSFWPDL